MTSLIKDDQNDPTVPHRKRSTLSEDDLYDELTRSVGRENTNQVRQFIDDVSKLGIEAEFKSAAVMLKIPDPNGESSGASLLAIEKAGRVYNPGHARKQALGWGWDEATVGRIIDAYWKRLHDIDARFSVTGMGQLRQQKFLPIQEVAGNLNAIGEAMKEAVADIQREAERVP